MFSDLTYLQVDIVYRSGEHSVLGTISVILPRGILLRSWYKYIGYTSCLSSHFSASSLDLRVAAANFFIAGSPLQKLPLA